MGKVFFLLLFLTFRADAYESGDSCKSSQRLPKNFICNGNLVVDCKNGGRLDSLICYGAELSQLRGSLDKKYHAILRTLDQTDTDGVDFKLAKQTLIKAQNEWEKFVRSDCDAAIYLNKRGSAQSFEMIHCEKIHVAARSKTLESWRMPNQ